MGDRALNETSAAAYLPRSKAKPKTVPSHGAVELKLADALLEPRASQALRSLTGPQAGAERAALMAILYPGAERAAERRSPGAIGYASYEQGRPRRPGRDC